jgi:hypothetical protein
LACSLLGRPYQPAEGQGNPRSGGRDLGLPARGRGASGQILEHPLVNRPARSGAAVSGRTSAEPGTSGAVPDGPPSRPSRAGCLPELANHPNRVVPAHQPGRDGEPMEAPTCEEG